jgi:ACDE family multidrug resistance protein
MRGWRGDPDHVRGRLALTTGAAVGTIYGVQGLAPAIPGIEQHLGLGQSAPGLMTAAYMLPAVIFALPFGYLADVIGRRRVFVATALIWSLAGMAQAWAGSLGPLLVLRFLQGVGFAALMPLSVTLIGDAVQGLAQMRAQAARQVQMTIGEFLLPLLGGGLAAIAWNVPLIAQGALLPLAIAGAFVLDDRAHATSSLGGYAVELAAVVRMEGMPALMSAGFLRFWCKFAGITYVPVVLIQARGATAVQAALVISLSSLVAAVASTQVVRLLRRAPASRLLISAVVLVGGGMVAYAFVPSWQAALGVSLFYGVGDGLLMVIQNTLVTEAAPGTVRAGLVAANGMIRNAGKLLAPLAVGVLILVISPSLALVVIGVVAWLALPSLRTLSRLDSIVATTAAPAPVVSPVPERST